MRVIVFKHYYPYFILLQNILFIFLHMKLIEHTFAIKNILSRGTVNEDSSFSHRLIAHFLQAARSRLIRQKIDKYNFISEQSYQNLCVPLDLSDQHNCCDAPATDCKVLKSTIIIPKFLTSRWGNFVTVMTLDGIVLPEMSNTQNTLAKYSITKPNNKTGWFMRNNELVILNNTNLRWVLINALFDNPEEIFQYNCNTDSSADCANFMDQEFPIDSDLVDPMYRLALELMFESMKLPKDYEADSRDE